MTRLRSTRQLLVTGLALLPLCCVAAEPALLAEAAERFAEQTLALPTGSAHAQSIDRQLPMGRCDSGWNWSFPYEARTTVQVSCTASPSARRFVSMRYDSATNGKSNAAVASDDSRRRSYVAATRDMPLGHVLTADDLEVTSDLSKGRSFTSTLSDPASLIGLALTRSIRSGEALGRADARPSIVVKRNSSLTGSYSFPGGQVYAKLIAMENGKAGDWIDLENPQSGRKLRGRVMPDGTVEIGRDVTSSALSRVGTENSALPVD